MRNRKLKPVIKKLARKYDLTEDQVNSIIESPYAFTKETLKNLELDKELSREEVSKLKTNFIYKYIGKLYLNINNFKK